MKRERYISLIDHQFKIHPVCALLGPRQVGKTTLAAMYAEKSYMNDVIFFDLENPEDLVRLENPMFALAGISESLIIIDEIQLRPDLFSLLRVIVDRKDCKNKFLILGSASRDLIRQSSETLAGRIGYLELTPFSLLEVQDVRRLWLKGGFPKSYLAVDNADSYEWRKQYVTTFLERDIPQLGFAIPAQHLRRFWMMIAHYHGQLLNSSEIARSLMISDNTVKRYIDILAGTFMLRVLYPWFENISKRQVKSPKIYMKDSGILHVLLGVSDDDLLATNPKLGASWEGFALEEVIRFLGCAPEEVYFWATHADAELDLLIVKDGKRLGFEFKYSDAPRATKSMHTALQDLALNHLYVIYPGDKQFVLTEKITVCGLSLLQQCIMRI